MAETLAFGLGEKTIVIASGPLSSAAIMGITPVLPQIAEALEHGSGSLLTKQLVGVVGLAMAVGSPLAGLAIGRTSPRAFMAAMALLYAMAGSAGLYLSDLRLLIVARFLIGLSAAGFVIMAITLINTRLEGVERARWMGRQVSVAMISALAISPLSGALGESGWRLPFAMYLVGVPVAVVAWAMLDGRVPVRTAARPNVRDDRRSLFAWLPWRFAGLALAIGSVTYIPVVYAPFLMRQMGATSPTLIGLILTADSIIGALVALAYGRSRKWLAPGRTFAFSFGFAAAGAGIAGLAPTLHFVILGMLVSGIGMGWMIPNLVTSLASEVSPQRQSQAAGVTKSFHYIASPLCILLVEPLASRQGPAGAMIAVALLALVLCLLFGTTSAFGRPKPVLR
jgi:predicted MFS family arabinose efflux permease